MKAKPPWQAKARKEYETSQCTLEDIAKKFNKGHSTVMAVSAREKWAKNQADNDREIKEQVIEIKQEIVKQVSQELRPVIQSKFYELIKEEEILKQKVKIERMRRAFGTIKDLYNDDGSLKAVKDLTEDEAPLVAGVKVTDKISGKGEDRTKSTETEFKFINADKDLEALEKMLGMYEPTALQQNNININLISQETKIKLNELFNEEY